MEQVLSLLSQQAVTMALCIPACTRQPPQDAWQPGHLSFQLVISGEIPTTPWHADQETIVQAGGLICCAAHAASTRRYDVDRKHLAFSVIGNQLHVHLYQRKATDPIGKGQEQRWQLQAPSAMSSLSQLIERGFREGLDASSLNHLAMRAPGILWQSL